MYQEHLSAAGYGAIATEIVGPPAPDFYFAEDYHQQYLDKIPNGYCPNHSTGVRLPDDFVVTPLQYVD
jgi:peptide-methionine (S)-S-oxide reductase